MSGEAAPFLRIEGLGKSFGAVPVLERIDLSVPAGRLLAVLGRSGSGKTTLLRLLAGFERADAGTIAIDGAVVASPGRHVAVERRRIGFVAQEGALFPHLSVAQNVLFGLDRAGRRDLGRAAPLLAMVGLPQRLAARRPGALSGGEQQRVALARALSTAPRLVLLDEPFSALDAGLRAETRRAVSDALAQAGATALLVTHDQSEAMAMGDAVAVLREGRLAQLGPPRSIYREPADPALALFVGEANLLRAVVEGGRALTSLGALALARPLPDGPATVMVRPEQLALAEPGGAAHAVVEACGYHGPEALLRLRVPAGDPPVLLARLAGHRAPPVGARVGLAVDGPVMGWPGTDWPGTGWPGTDRSETGSPGTDRAGAPAPASLAGARPGVAPSRA